jgi:hypothetical protein
MEEQDKREMKLNDEPLFVLRYHVFMRVSAIFICSFFIFFFGVCAFVLTARNTVQLLYQPVFGFLSFWLAFQVIDLLLFGGIRLYRDRIVQNWRLIGSREIKLANARLRGGYIIPGAGGKSFFNKDTNEYLGWLTRLFHLTGITYLEHLADPQDVKELNILLADLSGRKVEDFEGRKILMGNLIKEDMR